MLRQQENLRTYRNIISRHENYAIHSLFEKKGSETCHNKKYTENDGCVKDEFLKTSSGMICSAQIVIAAKCATGTRCRFLHQNSRDQKHGKHYLYIRKY
jgi:hypothetical protein